MPCGFHERSGELWCGDVRVAELADRFGTPLYVYDRPTMAARYRELREAFGDRAQICYAVKANGNLGILRQFAALGAGFDLVSGGELRRLQAAGVPTRMAVLAGVGKREEEIRAALAADVLLITIESAFEVDRIAAIARAQGRPARVALRLNPDVDAGTHAFLTTATRRTKFGLDLTTAAAVVRRVAADDWLELLGYHVHLGSLVREPAPYLEAFGRVERFLDGVPSRARGVVYYDLGGGFAPADRAGAQALDVGRLAEEILPRLDGRGLTPLLEPGRYLVAESGLLLTSVLGTKDGFVIVDAGMNDFLRPALYGAEHAIEPVLDRERPPAGRFDIVGPVCESADFLGKARELPRLRPGDLLAVFDAGAYGMSMASNYNGRPRPAEVLVDGERAVSIRRRERAEELFAAEFDGDPPQVPG